MDTRHTVTEPDRRGWHLDKTLSVSHLLTTVAIAGSIFIWANSTIKLVSNGSTWLEVSRSIN